MIILRQKTYSIKYNPTTKKYEGKVDWKDRAKSAAVLGTTGAGVGALLGGAVGKPGKGALIGAGIGGISGENDSKKTALAGGLIGAGLGAVTTWLGNITDQSTFNSKVTDKYNSYDFIDEVDLFYHPKTEEDSEVTTSETVTVENTSRTVTKKAVIRPKRESEGIRYDIDGDPKKHVVSILFSGSAALYINKANSREIQIINQVLDDYCKRFRNADYISENIGKGSWFVNVKLIEGYEDWVGLELIQRGIKLNIITGQRFGVLKH